MIIIFATKYVLNKQKLPRQDEYQKWILKNFGFEFIVGDAQVLILVMYSGTALGNEKGILRSAKRLNFDQLYAKHIPYPLYILVLCRI